MTPTPWKMLIESYGDEIWFGGEGEGTAIIYDTDDPVAYVGLRRKSEPEHAKEREANATLIVTAVNAHQALVDALKHIATYAHRQVDESGEEALLWAQTERLARAALALAREEGGASLPINP